MSVSRVSSVALVSSSPRTSPAYSIISPARSVDAARSVKTSGNVSPTSNLPAVKDVQPATSQNLPLGLLLSVSQPSANNFQATADYQDLRVALQNDNLTTAQQAYLRLQIDLVLSQPAQTAGQMAGMSQGSRLNATA